MTKVLPKNLRLNHIRAWILGIRDGWNQPYEVNTTYNVDHLDKPGVNAYDGLDAGINLGQRLRSPINHEKF